MDKVFYGVGEPLTQRERDDGIPAECYLDLVEGLGCGAFRTWMHLTEVLSDPYTLCEEEADRHRRLLSRAKEMGLEVCAMSHEWFLPEGCRQEKGHAMPLRDISEGSLYMQALDMLEQSWYTMVSAFPQVDIWEIGNEWNLNAFLQPDGFMDTDMSKPYTMDQKMDIAVDMMFFAAKGVRRANPKAKVTSFSPALCTPGLGGDMPSYLPAMYGIAWTLDKVYSRIRSGKFWSSNPDDYFDLVAWHPYVMSTKYGVEDKDLFLDITPPDNLWRDYNEAAYRVMCRYGDGHKQVILTETGFTDLGDEKLMELYADYNKRILEIAAELPYVRTMYNFRLLNENAKINVGGIEQNEIGGLPEVHFGIFKDPAEGGVPKPRALAIQKLTGATAKLDEICKKVIESNINIEQTK